MDIKWSLCGKGLKTRKPEKTKKNIKKKIKKKKKNVENIVDKGVFPSFYMP